MHAGGGVEGLKSAYTCRNSANLSCCIMVKSEKRHLDSKSTSKYLHNANA